MKFYPLSLLGPNSRTITIDPKSQADIIRIKVPEGYTLYLYLLIIDKWYPDTEYVVYIDGEEVYRYRRQDKFVYDPPYIVKKELRVVGVNNSNEPLPFGVFVDGVITS